MKIISLAFSHNGKIPRLYTCQGSNINPPLEFIDVPKNAESLALIMDDPDVPRTLRKDGMYVHWILYNMPPNLSKIAENSTPEGIQGKNTSGKNDYVGPCPPDREHRYFFKLYALDVQLDLVQGVTKEELLEAMEGHILDQAELIGLYEKSLQ